MSDIDAEPTAREPDAARFGAARILLVVVFGVIAAWFLYDGIGSLVNLPQLFGQLGIAAETPWAALWLGAVQAPVIFTAAALAARRLPVGRYALVLIATLGVIAALRLSLIAVATGVITVFPAS
ncbi:hypothetical protein [Microcella sp.]|uniref:hypothetical protein n=1 Tax=Microcella sp. TaxID=1913979 RepID=UPI00391D0637